MWLKLSTNMHELLNATARDLHVCTCALWEGLWPSHFNSSSAAHWQFWCLGHLPSILHTLSNRSLKCTRYYAVSYSTSCKSLDVLSSTIHHCWPSSHCEKFQYLCPLFMNTWLTQHCSNFYFTSSSTSTSTNS